MDQTAALTTVPPEPGAYARGVALVIAAGVLWSTAGIVIRSMEAAEPWQVVFYRSLGLVATLLVVLMIRTRGRVAESFWRAGWTSNVGGLCLAAAFVGFVLAIVYTTVANALFIQSFSIFIAALLGWLLMGEGIGGRTWAAMTLATAGVAIMVADGLAAGGLIGNLIALSIPLGFAGFTVAARYGARRVDMLPSVCLGGLFAMGLSAAVIRDFAIGGHDLALCLFLGTMQVGLGLMLYTMGARAVPAVQLTLLSTAEVILGPIWVWIGVGETPTLLALTGGAIVLGAVVYQALMGRRNATV